MKSQIIIVLGLVGLLLAGCKEDSSMAGTAVLEPTDEIVIREDTFPLHTMIDTCDYIISSPDSFLLGERQTMYGNIKTDILTQLACPEGYSYPEGVVFDSIRILLYYTTWTGGNLSPLSINIYEMDRQTLEYSPSPKYKTNEDVSRFCSLEDSTRILMQERIVVPSRYSDSAYSSSLGDYIPSIVFKVDPNSAFFKRFTSVYSYGTQDQFNQQVLKGFYITTNFGSSSVLHIASIGMVVDYHFSYERFDGQVVTEVGEKGFYANSEVKQINRYEYEDRAKLLNDLRKDSSLYDYIVAPAGVYTYVDLPMRQMYDTIYRIVDASDIAFSEQQYQTYAAYVNKAQLKVMVDNSVFWAEQKRNNMTYAPVADQVLLIKCGHNNERLHSFFENKELPSDTVAVLSTLYSSVNKQGDTEWYYSFDISTLITNILHTDPKALPLDESELRVALVPVTTVTSTNNNGRTAVVSIKEAQTVSATQLYSTKNPAAQTTLQVVSSRFYKDY